MFLVVLKWIVFSSLILAVFSVFEICILEWYYYKFYLLDILFGPALYNTDRYLQYKWSFYHYYYERITMSSSFFSHLRVCCSSSVKLLPCSDSVQQRIFHGTWSGFSPLLHQSRLAKYRPSIDEQRFFLFDWRDSKNQARQPSRHHVVVGQPHSFLE